MSWKARQASRPFSTPTDSQPSPESPFHAIISRFSGWSHPALLIPEGCCSFSTAGRCSDAIDAACERARTFYNGVDRFASEGSLYMRRPILAAAIITLALSLSACGGGKNKLRVQSDLAASKVTQIGVNSYLWRAALDTISFMPL